jgi:hypothetical protein
MPAVRDSKKRNESNKCIRDCVCISTFSISKIIERMSIKFDTEIFLLHFMELILFWIFPVQHNFTSREIKIENRRFCY